MAEKAEKNDAVEEKASKKPATSKAAAAKAPAKKATAKAADKPAAEKKAPAKTAAAKADKADAAEKAEKAPAAKKAAPKADAPASRPGVLKVHHLRPVPGARTAKTRVGRGEGSKGKTAGRGTKGTKARYQVKIGFEGGQMPLHMRTPKLRGFKNPFRVEYQVVNLEKLAELYPSGGDVTVGDLVAKGAVRKNEKVKVLGTGDISVKLNVSVDKVSGSAEQKIVAAGGTVK
ncbi:50S ribosomal protein L15 [Microbacterium gallinarum]|uniref:Large ribosomal subunit protein uL15 n=1 Tax=Microbacterium gallinarum TaxID=2762209 RepID=A0ABR8X371_9MICO|nr:50S ribosomal protein L15 [Microbacterium gallinarum]MBD8023785.1 50S ribosomal protein L15 [Microbacterium gallinarum]